MVPPFFKAKTILHAVSREIFAMQSGFSPSICVASCPVVWNIYFIEWYWHRCVVLYPDVHNKVRLSSYLCFILCFV